MAWQSACTILSQDTANYFKNKMRCPFFVFPDSYGNAMVKKSTYSCLFQILNIILHNLEH